MFQYASSLSRSTDGGGSFTGFGAGLPTGSVCMNLKFLVHPTTPETLLACCFSLWRITSPAGTWETIFTAPGSEENVSVAAVDGSVDLYYAGSDKGNLYAGPGGDSWQQVFAHPSGARTSDLQVDPDDFKVLYAAFAGDDTTRVYRMVRPSATPVSMTAANITANLPADVIVLTLAVDRMAPFTIYAGALQGVYQGTSSNGGATWSWSRYGSGLPLARVNSLDVHPKSGVMRAATYGRSAYEVYTDWPIGSLASASGRITFLRAHDLGTGWGPASDFLDVEVVIRLDSMPGRGFGFQLRNDSEEGVRHGMLDLLRDAFAANRPITIDYIKTGLRNGRILRVADLPSGGRPWHYSNLPAS
jgi:hypothetical protein